MQQRRTLYQLYLMDVLLVIDVGDRDSSLGLLISLIVGHGKKSLLIGTSLDTINADINLPLLNLSPHNNVI